MQFSIRVALFFAALLATCPLMAGYPYRAQPTVAYWYRQYQPSNPYPPVAKISPTFVPNAVGQPVRPTMGPIYGSPAPRPSGFTKFNDAEYQALGLPAPPNVPHVELPTLPRR